MPKVNCTDEDCVYCDGIECQAEAITIEQEPVNIDGDIITLCRCMSRETLEV